MISWGVADGPTLTPTGLTTPLKIPWTTQISIQEAASKFFAAYITRAKKVYRATRAKGERDGISTPLGKEKHAALPAKLDVREIWLASSIANPKKMRTPCQYLRAYIIFTRNKPIHTHYSI